MLAEGAGAAGIVESLFVSRGCVVLAPSRNDVRAGGGMFPAASAEDCARPGLLPEVEAGISGGRDEGRMERSRAGVALAEALEALLGTLVDPLVINVNSAVNPPSP